MCIALVLELRHRHPSIHPSSSSSPLLDDDDGGGGGTPSISAQPLVTAIDMPSGTPTMSSIPTPKGQAK